jgi:hypothetical protein
VFAVSRLLKNGCFGKTTLEHIGIFAFFPPKMAFFNALPTTARAGWSQPSSTTM